MKSSIDMPDELWAALKRLAARRHRSANDELNAAVEAWVEAAQPQGFRKVACQPAEATQLPKGKAAVRAWEERPATPADVQRAIEAGELRPEHAHMAETVVEVGKPACTCTPAEE